MKIAYLFFACFGLINSCKKDIKSNTIQVNDTAFFARGADVSWLSEMEASGKTFYDSTGKAQPLLTILQQYGINSIRLRVWVNPLNSWNSVTDVVAKALQVKAAGLHLMIDFHYSDTWADPGNQTTPIAWQGISLFYLKDSVNAHTLFVLNALKQNGIEPDWVQVGNETNDGMLWSIGKASTNMNNFAQLIASGYSAVKSVFPKTQVIVHVSNGFDNNLFRWLYDGLKANGAKWDIIGMSLYPSTNNWQTLNNQCLANMNDMISRYNTPVMIVEIGMPWDAPYSSFACIKDIVQKTFSIPNHKGLGVLYWEPEAYNWKGYALGCFDTTGKPTIALYGFKQ